MIVIGLTGSIGMGKTETARTFSSLGIPVFDSDAAVHDIYRSVPDVIDSIGRLVPAAVRQGMVDRSILTQAIAKSPDILKKIETIVHPAVRRQQEKFLADCRSRGEDLAVLDIPLLFETGLDSRVDVKIVVSAPAEVQRSRVLGRPGMTDASLDFILAKQMPDADKRRRADYVIDTSRSLDDARCQLEAVIDAIKLKAKSA